MDSAPPAPTTGLGPAPFRFALPGGPLRGPAFSLPFKLLALAIVLGCSAWLIELWRTGRVASEASSGLGWILVTLAMMAYMVWHILRSRTTLTESELHQSWVWDKRMALADLAYVKLIRIPGLDWLIAPRLYARTLLGKFAVFYAADRELIAGFVRLQQELQIFRQSR